MTKDDFFALSSAIIVGLILLFCAVMCSRDMWRGGREAGVCAEVCAPAEFIDATGDGLCRCAGSDVLVRPKSKGVK